MLVPNRRSFLPTKLKQRWQARCHLSRYRIEPRPLHPACRAGVIWKGDKLIEGVPETLDFLRSQVGSGAWER